MFRRPPTLALAVLAASLAVAMPSAARADGRCAVPLADWQPREALKAKLEGAGWKVLKIRADDGCYKVLAVDPEGRTVKSRFDPATLDRVEGRDHDGHGHRHGHEDDRDE